MLKFVFFAAQRDDDDDFAYVKCSQKLASFNILIDIYKRRSRNNNIRLILKCSVVVVEVSLSIKVMSIIFFLLWRPEVELRHETSPFRGLISAILLSLAVLGEGKIFFDWFILGFHRMLVGWTAKACIFNISVLLHSCHVPEFFVASSPFLALL